MGAPVKIKHPIHADIIAAAEAIGEREAKILKVLDHARPAQVRASELMEIVGLDWEYRHGYQHNNSMAFERYARFAGVLARLAQLLRCCGWQMNRTGGTAKDRIWISEQGVDTQLN